MQEMKRWDGIVVKFKDIDTLISWEATLDEEYIETTELYCYECFNKLSLSDLENTIRTYDHVTWSNNGHALPLYTSFCHNCNHMLNIHTEYCCESHQTKIAPLTRQGLLKIMAEQITKDQTLCPYIVIRLVYYHTLTKQDIDYITELGRQHISQFANTSAGIMMYSLEG